MLIHIVHISRLRINRLGRINRIRARSTQEHIPSIMTAIVGDGASLDYIGFSSYHFCDVLGRSLLSAEQIRHFGRFLCQTKIDSI